jgi:RNA polymerase sigma-70 factor (ECF subfamily)
LDSEVSDEILMARVSGGDMAALGILFERHEQSLFNFLVRFMRNRTWAEDVELDTFLRVYERRASYKTNAKFTTWLFTIAHNLAVDLLKQQARQQRFVTQSALELQHTSFQRQETSFDGYAATRMVRDAVISLPDDQRAVIILREYHELSYREIAQVTGASEQAVRVRAHRARQALKQSLSARIEGVTTPCEL